MVEKIYLTDFIKEGIRHRYASESKISADNIIFSNILDIDFHDEEKVLQIIEEHGAIFNTNFLALNNAFKYIINDEVFFGSPTFGLPRTGLNINYFTASIFHEFIKKVLGARYSSRAIPFASKSLKRKAKKLQMKNIVFIGFGGANSNIFYNLYLLKEVFQFQYLFNKVSIYENEIWEFTNIGRVGFPMIDFAIPGYKTDFLDRDPYFQISKMDILESSEFLNLTQEVKLVQDYLTENEVKEIIKENPDTIFIGAPDFETRRMLNRIGAQFLMVGHSDNRIRITKNPNPSNLVSETYGTIDIPVLLLNLWLATYKLIDILAEEDIEKIEPETELFSFDFNNLDKDFVKKLKNGFKNHFQNFIVTEEV